MKAKRNPLAKGGPKNKEFQSAPLVGGDAGHLGTDSGQSQAQQAGNSGGLPEGGHAPAWTSSGASPESCLKRYNSINGSLDSVGESLSGSGM